MVEDNFELFGFGSHRIGFSLAEYQLIQDLYMVAEMFILECDESLLIKGVL